MYFFVRRAKEITATVESGRLVVRQPAIQTLFCQPIDDHVIIARSQQPRRTPPERTASLIFAASKSKVNSVGTHSVLGTVQAANNCNLSCVFIPRCQYCSVQWFYKLCNGWM